MLRLLPFLLLLALAAPARAATLAEKLEAVARPLIDQGWIPSACVGVVREGQTQVFGFGRVRPGGGAPDGDTIYEIGSVTKTMTAILATEQAASGDFALTDAVSALIGAPLPAYEGRAITVEDLLTHHSGLPTRPPELEGQPSSAYHDYDAAKMLASLAAFRLPRAPGAAYEYSNQGFALAGHLLATRTGRSYPQLLASRLFAPLGMKDSAVTLSAEQALRFAPGFDGEGEPRDPWEPLVYDACGAVRSSVNDMLRYVQAQIEPGDGALGRAIAAAHAPRRDAGSPGLRIGLGWHVDANGTVWHNGQTDGYHAYVGFRRSSKIGVVVLTNASVFQSESIGHAALACLAGESFAAPPLPADLPVADVAEYTGRYAFEDGGDLTIGAQDGHLRLVATETVSLRLRQAAPDRFYLRSAPVRLDFARENGTVTAFTLVVGGAQHVARRVAN